MVYFAGLNIQLIFLIKWLVFSYFIDMQCLIAEIKLS